MGDTSDTQEFRELIERSSLGTPAARRLRARTRRSQATLAAQIAEHRERLAACRAAGDQHGAAQALTDLANDYLALGDTRELLDLARSVTQEALTAVTALLATAKEDAAAVRATAESEAADLRASALRGRDEILRAAKSEADELHRQAQRELEENEAQRLQTGAEFTLQFTIRRPEGQEADLSARLGRLPVGHPSSPYRDDGSGRPPPPDLSRYELPLPDDSGSPGEGALRPDPLTTSALEKATPRVLKFGELEMAIMNVMWAADSPCTVREVRERLQYDRPVAYTTVITVMDILYRKGVLQRVKHRRAWRYWPVEQRKEHDARVMAEVLRSGGEEELAMRQFVERVSDDEKPHSPAPRPG